MEKTGQWIAIRKVTPDAPWRWLSAASKDLAAAPLPCLLYGAAFALLSVLLAYTLFFSGKAAWMMALTGGFFIVAPILALGLYRAARTLNEGGTPELADMLKCRPVSPLQLAYLGLALVMIFFFWGSIAKIVYMLSTSRIYDSVQEFLAFITGTQAGITMAIIGTVIGGIIAAVAFSISVISAPLLCERETDIVTAMVASITAVKRNPGAMILWAGLIVVLIGLSILTGFVAFVFVFPWLGLATWHAYRDLTSGSDEVVGAEPAEG